MFSILTDIKCHTLHFAMIAYISHFFPRWKRYTIYTIQWVAVKHRSPRFSGPQCTYMYTSAWNILCHIVRYHW